MPLNGHLYVITTKGRWNLATCAPSRTISSAPQTLGLQHLDLGSSSL